MKNKTIFVSFIITLLGLSSENVYGFDLKDIIGPEQIAALAAGERPMLIQFNTPQPQLTPHHEALRRLIDTIRRTLEPSVIVETLYLYEKPLTAERNALSPAEEAGLYNEILALSTLAGLQYYSASRGTMRTFYETSNVIDSPATKRPIPDPVYSRPPAELTVYARQKDMTFGDNVYQYVFYTAPGTLIFTQENLTTLTAGIIPAVGKNNLRSTVAVIDAGNYLLVYAVSMAKAVTLPGMKERIGNSFSNRAEAILHWFSAQADNAFRKIYGSL